MWTGSEWIPVPPAGDQTLQMQDSVIAGDLVSTTTIQSSDAAVVQAAMEGVVASIKELQQPQQFSHSSKHPIPRNPQDIMVTNNFQSKKGTRKNSKFKIVIGMLLMVLPGVVGIYWYASQASQSSSHPIIDTWDLANEGISIQFHNDNTITIFDEIDEVQGTWVIDDGTTTNGYITINGVFKDDALYYYHISRNMLVIHGVDDNGDGCDPWVREGFSQTKYMRETEVSLATHPDFCNLRDVE
jgi:hypothetical protein